MKAEKVYSKKEHEVLAATHYLRGHDYIILDTSWKCNFGEVDIVAMDNDCLTFIEVKSQKSFSDTIDGFPTFKKTKTNRTKYENIALAYLITHDYKDLPMRFDTIGLVILGDSDRCVVKHAVNAFGVVD